MSRFLVFVTICGWVVMSNVDGRKLEKIPSYLKICHRSDPNINECIEESVNELKPHLIKGIPELGIPPCEPLIIPEIIMNQGKGSVIVQSVYKDIKVYGPSNFDLISIKVDLDKDRVRLKVFFPQLQMTSNYSINGRILMLPITGSGYSFGNYSDIEATAVMQGERVVKEGKVYFQCVDFFVDFVIGHCSVHLTNLFNGDKELGDAMNLFLNDNWRTVTQELKPILEETLANMFKKFCNKIYSKYPLDELMPP